MEINALLDLYATFKPHLLEDKELNLQERWYLFDVGTPKIKILDWFVKQNPMLNIQIYKYLPDGTPVLAFEPYLDKAVSNEE